MVVLNESLNYLFVPLGTIAVIFFLTTRKLPYPYIGKMGQVLAAAFGTGSSSAIMPVTIGCLDDMGIDPRVTRFVIPVGATINMDGTALYVSDDSSFKLTTTQLKNSSIGSSCCLVYCPTT